MLATAKMRVQRFGGFWSDQAVLVSRRAKERICR